LVISDLLSKDIHSPAVQDEHMTIFRNVCNYMT